MTAFAPELRDPVVPGNPPDGAGDGPDDDARGRLAEYFAVDGRRRAGRRHGRFVGLAKLLFLTLAAGLIVLVAVWPQLGKDENIFRLGSVKIEREDVETLRVVNARFTGTSDEGRPYTMTFDSASQTSNDSDLVTLIKPQADIVLSDGAWVAVTAPKGRLHKENRILELDDAVDLFHDSGLHIHTGDITFNLESGTGAGYEPLNGQAPFGQFESQGFRIRENAAVFQFIGPVRASLFAAPEIGR